MKIALLTYSIKPRGSVMHTLALAAALTERGHTVWVFALDKDGSGFEQTLPFMVQLVPAQPAPGDIDQLIQQRIREFVDGFQAGVPAFDIYHAQDCIGANALLMLREAGVIPHFVRTVHHVEAFHSPYLRACQDRSIYQPDLCLCVSDRWQQVLARDYGIQAARVINGIDVQRFSPVPSGQETALKARYGLTGNPIYLTIGGIEPRKNSIGLLQAFAQVLAKVPQAQLVIAGGATLFDYQPYRAQFFAAAAARQIDLHRAVVLPGVVAAADLPVLYRCADVFCFPSLQEGWGLVVMEAIASGLPVVVSQQPPFTEFLAPNQALWADPQSATSIAKAMLAGCHSDMTQMVQRSQAVLSDYHWSRSAALHEGHYQALVQQLAPTGTKGHALHGLRGDA
ncbi:MAG: MSMEG_0565 family glycosyltransferase [Leptolyngbyaceae cyanobacterium]